MKELYRVTIHGRVLESGNLRQLLSRAVAEKRSMDTRCRTLLQHRARWQPAIVCSSLVGHTIESHGSV